MTDTTVRTSGPSQHEPPIARTASPSRPAVMTISSLRWPVSGRITSPRGADRATRLAGKHQGLDIEVSPGTAVVAAGAGRVTRAGVHGRYGNCVDITHGRGYVTRYAHLSKILTSVGTTVSAGQKIGLAGCTGGCSLPHLHVGVYLDGTDITGSSGGPAEGQWVSVGTTLRIDVGDAGEATPSRR